MKPRWHGYVLHKVIFDHWWINPDGSSGSGPIAVFRRWMAYPGKTRVVYLYIDHSGKVTLSARGKYYRSYEKAVGHFYALWKLTNDEPTR